MHLVVGFPLHKKQHKTLVWPSSGRGPPGPLNYGDTFEFLNYSLNKSRLLRELPFTNIFLQYHFSDGIVIEPGKNVKDLGVSRPYIWQMLVSARKVSAWVLSIFRTRPPLLTLNSKLEYCCPVWDPSKIDDICGIEIILGIEILGVWKCFSSKIATFRTSN